MIEQVETPLIQRFRGKTAELKAAAAAIGGEDHTNQRESSGLNFYFQPPPNERLPLHAGDSFSRRSCATMAKSERLRQLLCEA